MLFWTRWACIFVSLWRYFCSVYCRFGNKSVTVTSTSTVNHPVGDDDGFTGSCTEAQMLVKPVM